MPAPHPAGDKGAVGQRHDDRTAASDRWSAVAVAGLLASGGAVAALHVLRPELDPLRHRLSEYAVGPFGWLMTAAFVAFAASLWALRRGRLERTAPLNGRHHLGAALLGAAALGMVVSAAFETDVSTPAAPGEIVHSMASSVAFSCLVGAAVWTSLTSRHDDELVASPTAHALTAVIVLGAVASPFAHDSQWTGLVQRLSYLAISAWLLLLARSNAIVRR